MENQKTDVKAPLGGLDKDEMQKLIEDTLDLYPATARKRREPHLAANDPEDSGCTVKSNRKVVPGVMSSRGCAYAGAKGVVMGPVRDIVNISHGPVGCGWYSWGTRRNLVDGKTGVDVFMAMQFTSDYQERDIVYGGDKKLATIIREVNDLFPLIKGISIMSECPVGLIGDDINAVARHSAEEIDKLIIPCNCEGFRGVSQSLGHHIANDGIRDHVIGQREFVEEPGPYDIGIVGDYNIGGDAWASKALLEELGLNVKSIWTGDGQIEHIAANHSVKLNLIHCYRSMNYMATEMEKRYGIPWMEFNFFGPTKIAKSLRAIAAKFDEKIQENAEKLIAKYQPEMQKIVDTYRPRLEGKKVMLYVGGLRPRHTIGAYEDLGMEIVGTGYEFAHNADYERTYEQLAKGTVIFDDVSEIEMEKFAEKLRPDLVGSGIKEKYVFQKAGIPFRQMHSWDYSGPYHGYLGFPVFARDIDMAINNPSWGLVKAPF
jgi:nitrogenase molybdenum-iron protein alpha chain